MNQTGMSAINFLGKSLKCLQTELTIIPIEIVFLLHVIEINLIENYLK